MEANEFFKGVRRELQINDFHVLRSTGSERRIKINMRMPLGGGRPVIGLPEWVLDARENVTKDGSPHRKVICEVDIEGVTTEFFTTPESKRRTQVLNGCLVKQFAVERVGKDEKTEVYLNFVGYAPCSEEIVLWMYKHLHESTFAQFDATQASFLYAGEGSDSDADQEELPLVGDEFDADRREALKPENDEQFATTPRKSAKKGGRKK